MVMVGEETRVVNGYFFLRVRGYGYGNISGSAGSGKEKFAGIAGIIPAKSRGYYSVHTVIFKKLRVRGYGYLKNCGYAGTGI